jgi:hypothetical protein
MHHMQGEPALILEVLRSLVLFKRHEPALTLFPFCDLRRKRLYEIMD